MASTTPWVLNMYNMAHVTFQVDAHLAVTPLQFPVGCSLWTWISSVPAHMLAVKALPGLCMKTKLDAHQVATSVSSVVLFQSWSLLGLLRIGSSHLFSQTDIQVGAF